MSVFYDLPASDNALLRAFRVVVGVAMAVSLVLGVAAVRKRDFGAHRAWVMRGYALGIGAGTQVLTHVPWRSFVPLPGGVAGSAPPPHAASRSAMLVRAANSPLVIGPA